MATNPRDVGDLTRAVAAEIRVQRARREIKQEVLSVGTGIPQSTLSRMERGQVAIDLEQVDRIAQVFDMEPSDFITSAMRHAAEADPDYRPDGTLDPDAVRGAVEPDDHLAEAAAHRKERSAGRRTSTPAT